MVVCLGAVDGVAAPTKHLKVVESGSAFFFETSPGIHIPGGLVCDMNTVFLTFQLVSSCS